MPCEVIFLFHDMAQLNMASIVSDIIILGPYLWGKISEDIHSKTCLRAFMGTV